MASTETVRDFLNTAYQLISSQSPTVPLRGDDQLKALFYLNELLSSYSGTGLMTTISKQVDFVMTIGQQFVTFADPNYFPAADVQQGRLSNMQNAWLLLEGVTYPLKDESRNIFFDSYKYNPQQGLPRYVIITNEVDVTRMRVYPSPSQLYQLFVYGKFELPSLGINDKMSLLPSYYRRFLRFSLAKDLSLFKARSSAWTSQLQDELDKSQKDMESISSVNLTIQTDNDSCLNGSWRVKAGI